MRHGYGMNLTPNRWNRMDVCETIDITSTGSACHIQCKLKTQDCSFLALRVFTLHLHYIVVKSKISIVDYYDGKVMYTNSLTLGKKTDQMISLCSIDKSVTDYMDVMSVSKCHAPSPLKHECWAVPHHSWGHTICFIEACKSEFSLLLNKRCLYHLEHQVKSLTSLHV